MRKIFSLILLGLLCSIGTTWATDYVLAAGTFSNDKKTSTVSDLDFVFSKAHGGAGQSGYSDYIKFSKASTYTLTLPEGFQLTNINIKGYTNKDGNTNGEITSIGENAQTGKTFPARNDANLATNACITDGYDFAISQTGGSVDIVTANTNQICVLITISGTAPAPVAVDPVFSLSRTSISTLQSAQIKVGTKDGLDGIELSNITYGTSGVVTVDAETGEITPVAAGTTTINFNSSAVANKYNASTGNSLTITVTQPVLVYDAAGLNNQEIILSQANVEANDYLACNSEYWADKGWSAPYNGGFLDMKTNRILSITVKNVSAFEFYLSGSGGRNYFVTVGDADAVEYTQGGTGSGFISSGVIPTGTLEEVVIKIEGGENTLYPVYIKLNPAAVITPSHEYVTYVTENAIDFSGVTGLAAFVATGAIGDAISLQAVTAVPAATPLLLHGTAATEYAVPMVASAAAPAANLLVAGAGEEVSGADKYVLSIQNEQYVFASLASQGVVVPEGKAYLDLSGANAPSVIRIVENATNIMNVDDVENAVKFIENGKLYIKKNGVTYNVVGAVVK